MRKVQHPHTINKDTNNEFNVLDSTKKEMSNIIKEAIAHTV